MLVAAASGHGAIAEHLPAMLRLLEAFGFDLVLLDLLMPGARSFAPLAWLRNQFPGTAVMIVSATEDPEVIRRAREFGAAGYVVKSASTPELIDAIREVSACGQWFPPGIAAMARRAEGSRESLATRLNSLTPQQYRVLELVAQGKLNKQIADVLGIQERTVKAHLSAIFERLGYPFPPDTIPRNVAYYSARTSHGSTLSRVVDSWVLARSRSFISAGGGPPGEDSAAPARVISRSTRVCGAAVSSTRGTRACASARAATRCSTSAHRPARFAARRGGRQADAGR